MLVLGLTVGISNIIAAGFFMKKTSVLSISETSAITGNQFSGV